MGCLLKVIVGNLVYYAVTSGSLRYSPGAKVKILHCEHPKKACRLLWRSLIVSTVSAVCCKWSAAVSSITWSYDLPHTTHPGYWLSIAGWACCTGSYMFRTNELRFGNGRVLVAGKISGKSCGRNKVLWPLFDRVSDSGDSTVVGFWRRSSMGWCLVWGWHFAIAEETLCAARVACESEFVIMDGDKLGNLVSNCETLTYAMSDSSIEWTTKWFNGSYWTTASFVRYWSDIEFCNAVSSSLDNIMGSVCMSCCSSITIWVVPSAMVLFFQNGWGPFLMVVFGKFLRKTLVLYQTWYERRFWDECNEFEVREEKRVRIPTKISSNLWEAVFVFDLKGKWIKKNVTNDEVMNVENVESVALWSQVPKSLLMGFVDRLCK